MQQMQHVLMEPVVVSTGTETLTLYEQGPSVTVQAVIQTQNQLQTQLHQEQQEALEQAHEQSQQPQQQQQEPQNGAPEIQSHVAVGQIVAVKNRARRGRPVGSESKTGTTEVNGNEALLSCLVCGKNFVSYGRLKSHEKTHSKSRPFKCVDCGKTFTVRYSLICHTRVHTRERPYHCAVCGSRFSQASSLKTHQIYKHTKEFPYECKFCKRGFISPGQELEHINRTHLKQATPGSRKAARKSAARDASVVTIAMEAPAPPTMTTASVQTHLSLPPGPVY